MSKHHLIAAAALASLTLAGAAHAATETLTLTGTVADSTYGTYTGGGITYNTWTLPLSGFPTNGVMVSQGDEVDGTITLDQNFSINIPKSDVGSFSVVAFGGSFSSSGNRTDGITKFLNGTTVVEQGNGTFIAFTALGFSGGYGSLATFTFDSISFDYNITALSQPATLTSATLNMDVPNGSFSSGGGGGVPEPAAWSLMLVGVAGMGSALRSRRRPATAVAV